MFTFRIVLILVFACALVSPKQAQATLNDLSDGRWKVTGKGGSGAIGSIIPITFSFTSVSDQCISSDFDMKTTGEARQKLSFVGSTVPSSATSISPEAIVWPRTEFEDGVVRTYKVNVRIDHGVVGDEIDGFYVYIYCASGKSLVYGVVDDIRVKVVAKSNESVSKAKVVTKAISSADLTTIFKSVYGRNPTASEKKYWAKRWLDKPNRTALKGAIVYHKQKGIRH